MSDEDRYIEAHFFLEKGGGSEWDEGEIDDFLDDFLEFIESKNMFCGGSVGKVLPEDMECGYCQGSGKRDFIEEEDRCETCGGSGHKTEEEPKSNPDAEQEWHKIYAPVAQGTEQPFPKGQVEGSNPSRSANVWNGCDRESTGEAERQDISSDDRGDREGREDLGRNYSGEDG